MKIAFKLGIVLMALIGAVFLFTWYDQEYGTGAREREERYRRYSAEMNARDALNNAIWDNCVRVIGANADKATLRVTWEGALGRDRTENGWKANLIAEDATATLRLSCYTDQSGNVVRVVKK